MRLLLPYIYAQAENNFNRRYASQIRVIGMSLRRFPVRAKFFEGLKCTKIFDFFSDFCLILENQASWRKCYSYQNKRAQNFASNNVFKS